MTTTVNFHPNPHSCEKRSPNDASPLQLTQSKACCQIVLMFVCASLFNLPIMTLYGLQTSLNGVLGSVTTALQFALTAVVALFTGAIQSALGLKASLVSAVWIAVLYVVGYFYPTWPTLVISNILLGIAAGPILTVTAVYANILARSLAKSRGKDPKNYIPALQGFITIGGFYFGGVVGNTMSSVVILLTQHSNDLSTNHTEVLNGTDFLYPHLNSSDITSNVSTEHAALCQMDQVIYTLPDLSYYLLVSLTAVAAMSAALISLGVVSVPGQTLSLRKLAHVRMFRLVKVSLSDVCRTGCQLRFLSFWPLVVYSGLDFGFGASFYTKFFVSDCIGVGYIGAATTLRFLALVISSIASGMVIGRIPRWLSSSFNLFVSLTLSLAMLFWVKEPSFAAIFLMAVVLGVNNGLWSQWLTAQLGEFGKGKEESVFGLFWSFRLLGACLIFLLSSFMSDFVAVAFLAAFLVLAYALFLVVEIILAVRINYNSSAVYETVDTI